MRAKMAKMRAKMAKIRLKIAKMRPKMMMLAMRCPQQPAKATFGSCGRRQ